MRAREVEPPRGQRPTACPQCGSRDLTTMSKVIDARTYWRCQTCGEVWNTDRRNGGSRFGFRR